MSSQIVSPRRFAIDAAGSRLVCAMLGVCIVLAHGWMRWAALAYLVLHAGFATALDLQRYKLTRVSADVEELRRMLNEKTRKQ